jgi:cation transport ATPase
MIVDAAIIKGQAIMDESALTGETTPVHKVTGAWA